MKKSLLILASLLLVMSACDDKETPAPQVPKQGQEKPDNSGDKENPGSSEEEDSLGQPGQGVRVIDIPHYVTGYIYPGYFRVDGLNNRFEISYGYDQEYPGYSVYYDREESSHEGEYKALCEKRGDMLYSGGVRTHYPSGGKSDPYVYLAVDIVSIDVVADKAWGDRPAGASWADVCWLVSLTPRQYIASGYKDKYDWSVVPKYFSQEAAQTIGVELPCLAPVSKRLSECTAEDLSLMSIPDPGYACSIYLADGPIDYHTYNFTFTITTADGKVWTVPAR